MSPTSSLSEFHAPSSASDEDECKYLIRTRLLHWTRTAISLLTFVFSVTIVACEAHPVHYYHQTNKYGEFWLHLWPSQLDLRPSVALIACGAIILVQSLAYVIVALLPSPRSRTLLFNIFTSFNALTGLIMTTTATAFSVLNINPRNAENGARLGETIHSWTCTWGYADGLDRNGDKVEPVLNFGRLCRETRASFAIMCVLVALMFLSCVSAGVGWTLEKEMKRKRREAVDVAQAEKQDVYHSSGSSSEQVNT